MLALTEPPLANEALWDSVRVGVELLEGLEVEEDLTTLTSELVRKLNLGSFVEAWNHRLKSRFTLPSDAIDRVVVSNVFVVFRERTEPGEEDRG